MMVGRGGMVRWLGCSFLIGWATAGCQWFVDDADREVYRLIEARQQRAVGVTRNVTLDRETAPIKPADSAYDFVPHPVDGELPPSFAGASTRPALVSKMPSTSMPSDDSDPSQALSSQPASAPDENSATATRPADAPAAGPAPTTFTLAEALAYAFEHSRDYQNAKEDLYLAALALTLERHLWTPRFVGNIRSQYANFGEIRHFDNAMDAVSTVGVEQKLPFGGQLTAEVVNTLMRDLTNNVTTAETGDALLRANIPLLKGAGQVAYESRYQAERDLIYAVRTFERFRRFLAVDIASDYFNLQQLRQGIINSGESIEGFEWLALRARWFFKAGKVIILDVQRAEQDQLNAISQRIDAVERYQTAIDTFKVRIGMPTRTNITVELPPEVAGTQPADSTRPAESDASRILVDALAMPPVDDNESIRVALKYRLDLLNQLDQIGDAERGVVIAENSLLPALDAFATVQYDTDPGKLGTFEFEHDRTTFRTGLNLELPLDRKAERNTLRQSLILKRRAQRAYEEARDIVVQQVRRAIRRVAQQAQSLEVQIANSRLAQQRLRAAKFRYQRSLVPSLEVVDAQNALLEAQNNVAQAQAEYKVAILEFWRDTDTLRVGDDGRWQFGMEASSENR